MNRFGSKKSRSDQNQHVHGITGIGMFGLTQLTSTTWAGNLLGIQVVVPERRDCSLHMLCKQGLNSWALEEPISETPSESIPLHEWVNPAGFVTNSLWVNYFKGTLQHIYIYIYIYIHSTCRCEYKCNIMFYTTNKSLQYWIPSGLFLPLFPPSPLNISTPHPLGEVLALKVNFWLFCRPSAV